jgi:hypothetical protein
MNRPTAFPWAVFACCGLAFPACNEPTASTTNGVAVVVLRFASVVRPAAGAVDIDVLYRRNGGGASRPMLSLRVGIDGEEEEIALAIDVGTCLRDPEALGAPAACTVDAELTLLDDALAAIDQLSVGPMILRAGLQTAAPAATLVRRPRLIHPIDGARIKQNNPATGCAPDPRSGYSIRIDFDWQDVPGAIAYELVAQNRTALNPIVDTTVIGSSQFTDVSCGSYVVQQHLSGWEWMIRAIDDGNVAGPWSLPGVFEFEECILEDGSSCG